VKVSVVVSPLCIFVLLIRISYIPRASSGIFPIGDPSSWVAPGKIGGAELKLEGCHEELMLESQEVGR